MLIASAVLRRLAACTAITGVLLASLAALLAGPAAAAGPQFTGTIPTLGIWAGTENLSAYDVAANFWDPDGDPLTFSPNYLGNLVPNFTVSFNGSIMELRSTNANDWGVQWLLVRAQDPGGSGMYSNVFMIHVGPTSAPASREWYDSSRLGGGNYQYSVGCRAGYPSFDVPIPADARVLEYSFDIEREAVLIGTGPNGTGDPLPSATAARIVASMGSTEILNRSLPEIMERMYFDAAAMTTYAQSHGLFGIADVPISIAVCGWDGQLFAPLMNNTMRWVRVPAGDNASDLDPSSPAFSGSIPDFQLGAGGTKADALHLGTDYFSDADGDPLEYTVYITSAPGYPDGVISFELAAQVMGFRMLDPNWIGNMTLYIVARDPAGSSARSNNFTVMVAPVAPANTPPAPTQPLPALSAPAGENGRALVDLAAYFTDDGPASALRFAVVEGPEAEWANVNVIVAGSALSVEFLGPMAPASLTLQVLVTDGDGATYLSPALSLTIEARAGNHAPAIDAPSSAVVELGSPALVTLHGSDADGDPLVWGVATTDAGLGASYDADAGVLTIDANGLDERQTFAVTLTAADGWGASTSATISVDVWDPSHVPVIALQPSADASGAAWVNGTVSLGAQPQGAGPLTVTIRVDAGGELTTSLVAGVFGVRLESPLAPGNHTIRASIADAYGRTGTASAEFRVPEPPVPLPEVPHLVDILSNGVAVGSFEEGAPLHFAVVTDAPLPAGVAVSWYLDGQPVGDGADLEGLSAPPGLHTLEARASNGQTEHSLSVSFRVNARLSPTAPQTDAWGLGVLAWGLLILGTATLGVFVVRTEAGRYLLLAALVGSVFSKLKRPSLLDHFVRGALYQEIRREPGIHFGELRRRTALPPGQASHHLRMLEKGGYIRVVIQGTNTRFFATDHKLDPAEYGISPKDREVLEAVADSPGITQRDLSVRLGRSSSAVSRSVSRLIALGYLVTARKDRGIAVFPRNAAEDMASARPPWPDEGA